MSPLPFGPPTPSPTTPPLGGVGGGGLAPQQTNSLSATPSSIQPGASGPPNPPKPLYDSVKILELFNRLKSEALEYRWIWEREWLRDLYYVMNRQWITYSPSRREWVDKRLQKWVPRPVTNKMAETLQAIRSNLAAINLIATVRPVGGGTADVAAAEIADQMAPLIHEEHLMGQVMNEADFWFIVTGNSVLHISWDKDQRSNRVFVPQESCLGCGGTFGPQEIVQAGQKCPTCGSPNLSPAKNLDGTDAGQWISFGKGKTRALSPFEYAVPSNVTRWDDLPYLIVLRWKDKHWFEANRPDLVPTITWQKAPADRSLQIFKSLALTNDIGTGSQMNYLGAAGASTVEGVTEYECWVKPTPEYPQGLVFRVIGDSDPIVLDLPEENLPGPFPLKDIQGNPLFPFLHAQYEQVGGRLYGRSALSVIVQKQDQLNQLDSLVQLCVQRTANPVWVVPENSGIEHFTGEPGLVMKWNPLASNGLGKPDRIPGADIPASLFNIRQQYLDEIEALSGTYDILKGQKPTGIEAFSALQLLVERSQSRFTSAFKSRGEMYRRWLGLALEQERQYGPERRTWAVVAPNRGYTFKHFENAQLQGAISVSIEDGSTMPKTALGKRAAIEQASQMQLLNPQDPDQKYALLENFGLADLVPSLNFHVQAALNIQDAFEQWADQPMGPSPLVVKPWFDPHVHWVERVKWLNTDKMRQLLAEKPGLEPIIVIHLSELQAASGMLQQPAPVGHVVASGGQIAPPAPQGGAHHPGGPMGLPGGGAGQALNQSNRQSGAPSGVPHGNNQLGPHQGPA